MSPGNQGVFQLLKEVAFWGIQGFFCSSMWSYLGVVHSRIAFTRNTLLFSCYLCWKQYICLWVSALI